MLVHLLVSGLFAAIVWRATGSGLLAGLFWLGITGAMGEVGRPEEYALLFGTLVVLSVESTLGRLALCIPLLGMSGAISPLTAALSTMAVVGRLLLNIGWKSAFIWRAVGVLVLAPTIAVGIFFWHIHPYFAEAWQHIHAISKLGWWEPLGQLLVDFNAFNLCSFAIFWTTSLRFDGAAVRKAP